MLPSCMKMIAEARQSVKEIAWEDVEKESGGGGYIIDVREPDEFAGGSVPGAFNMPRGLLEFKIQTCPEFQHLGVDELLGSRVFLFCRTGGRSTLAALSLEALGFSQAYSISGGLLNRP